MSVSWRAAVTLCLGLLTILNVLSQERPPAQSGKFVTFREALRNRHIELTKPSLLEALRNPDAQVRYLAALTLAEDKATDTVPAIIHALESETVPETRTNIAFALAELGEQRGFATLRRMCDKIDVPGFVRLYATKYMLDLGDEHCLGTIFDVLESRTAFGTRTLALSLLPRFKKVSDADSQRIIAATVSALADPMPDVRIAASHTISSLAATIAIPSLEDAIAKETEDTVRSRMQVDLQRLQEMQQKKQP
jgi:HEAT repeat protein